MDRIFIKKPLFFIFSLIILTGFLFWPKTGKVEINPEEAINNPEKIELKEKEAKKILNSLIQKIVDEKIYITTSPDFSLEKQVILVIVKKVISRDLLNYLTIEVPIETGKNLAKFTVKVASLVLSEDVSGILDQIETITVNEAKKYAMEWLLQKEIRIASGNLETSYKDYGNNQEDIILPCIIVYKPIDYNRAEVGIEIYSSKTIKTPFPTLSSPWEGGIEELKPFILRINGEVEKQNNGVYLWTKNPEFNVVFDEPVPEFDFKKPSFLDKLRNRLDETTLAIGNAIEKIGDIVGGVGQDVKDTSGDIFNKIKSILSNLNIFRATVAPDLSSVKDDSGIDFSEIEIKPTEEISQLIEGIKEKEGELSEGVGKIETAQNRQTTLEEIQEILDDITEKVDVLNQELAKLIESSQQNQQQNQQEDAGEEEELEDEETSQDYPADNQQNQSTTQTTQTASGGGGGGASANYCGRTTGTQSFRDKIIINEIAWMGSSISANDEWIELKNITNNLVNIAGWQILDKEKQIKIIFPEGKTISAGGFYLLERTDNNSVPGVSADLIYTGILNDTNEALYLFDSNCQLQDEAVADPDWLAGNKDERRSMERGSDLNWHTYAGIGINGIMGTPKTENSQTTPATPSPTGQNDITAPQVIFALSPTQNSLSFTISFGIIDVVTTSIIDGVEETVTPSGLEGFVFRWKEESGDWQEDVYQEIDGAPTDFSGQKQFTGEDEKTYYFQIKAKDIAGNESGWLPETPATATISLPKIVLINEIQTDSKEGDGGTNDDWVELYSPNDFDIFLDGWSIQKHSADEPCSIEKSFYKKNFSEDAVILAKGFFLVVDTGARDELKAIADMTIGWSLSKDNTIYLVKNQDKIENGDDPDVVDKVGFGIACFAEGSPALNPPKEKSIGRKELGLDTDDNSQDFIVNETISPTNSKNQTLQAITTAVWPVFQYNAQHTGRSNFAGPTIVNNRSVYDLIGIQGSSFTSVLQPVIGFDKTIYFGIKEPDAKLYAMNPDGTKKWEAVLDGWAIAIALGPDNVIYASIRDKGIVAFDSDGAEKWRFYPDGASEVSAAIIGEDGIIYFTDYSNLYCINPDGSQNWLTGNAPRGGGAFGGPAIGLDNTIYVVWTGFRNDIDQDQGQLLAYNSDGAIKWRTPLEFRAGAPIIDSTNGIIYVTAGTSGPLGTTRMVLAFGFDGVEKWRSERESGSFLSALSSDNFLIQADNWSRYVGESGGSAVEQPMSQIKAFDSSGNVAWEIGPESNSSISTQPISDKNGNIYFGETIYEGGGWWFPVIGYKLYSVDRNGAINWSYDVPGEFLSSLAIGDNKNIFALIAEGTANEKYIKIYSFGE